MAGVRFPNESDAYRAARSRLLEAEAALRAHMEEVARQRRQLPEGGEVPQDYEFEELVDGTIHKVRFSELFGDKDTLFAYSFMYAPDMADACPMCTSMLDGLDGQAQHIRSRISLVVVARHDVHTLQQFAQGRGWTGLRLLSSRGNSYNVDYHAEVDGRQTSTANVFQRRNGSMHHFWNSELSYEPMMEGGNMRHVDLLWPLWNVLDMTPGGRGDWYPALDYDTSG